MAWRITDYNMQSISHKTEASINREYNRLRNIVEKRIKTFERHDKGKIRNVQEARQAIGENNTTRDRAHAIVDMKRFLVSQHSSYQKYEKTMRKTIDWWRAEGVKGLNMDNIDEFLDFLDWVRDFYDYKYKKDSPYPPTVIEDWNNVVSKTDTEGLIEFFRAKMYGGL